MTFTTFRRLLAAAAVFAVLSGADPAFAAPVRSDKPAEPEETVQAPNGLLVNKCVPEPLRHHTISLRASDGLRTSGLALGSGNKGVVLEHENGRTSAAGCRSRGSWSTRATTSCCLRARGTAASAGEIYGTKRWDRDVLAASQELTRRGATAIVAGGASLGGTAAATAAPKIPNLAGLVIFSSPHQDYGAEKPEDEMDAIAAVKTVTKPSFFAVSPGDGEGDAYLNEVPALYKASGATEKHLETVEGGSTERR